MSLLVIQIPSKPRLRARGLSGGTGAAGAPLSGTELAYVWSSDGRQVDRHGSCAPALMPKADSVVAVLSDADLSWHRVLIPKAAPNRLRSALAGLLEEALLDDAATAHFALGPQSRPGETGLVAVTDRRWLGAAIAALEQVNLSIDRVAPLAWPVTPAVGHFTSAGSDNAADDATMLSWADANGVVALGLQGGLARALLPQPIDPQTRFSSTPAAAASAERWLGAPVSLLTENERLLAAARSPWNLRQFELVRRHRGSLALRDVWRSVLGRSWRPVRIGLLTALAVQLIGSNLWAWQLRSEVSAKRAQMTTLLQTSFPHVTGVLDAPLQMRREVQMLRERAGKPGESDLEPLLLAAASAWPAGRPPVDSLNYEPGRLSLPAGDWQADEIERFGAALRAIGYQVNLADGRLQLSAAAARVPS